jgi:hypothetical protein
MRTAIEGTLSRFEAALSRLSDMRQATTNQILGSEAGGAESESHSAQPQSGLPIARIDGVAVAGVSQEGLDALTLRYNAHRVLIR